MKRLHKSETDKKVSGVCAGVAEYYDVDPTLVRVGYVVLTLITGVLPGLVAYVIVAAIMPKKSEVTKNG